MRGIIYFTKGAKQPDGHYSATCKYCGKIYKMGNQKSTSSMTHHWKYACKKIPKDLRKNRDPGQKFLAAVDAAGKYLLIFHSLFTYWHAYFTEFVLYSYE